MQTLDIATFKEKIFNFEEHKQWAFQGQKPAVIDFYADWCSPCHALAPIFQDVSEKYQQHIDFYKVNTDASPELAHLFEVKGIPAVVFIPINEEPAMNAGVISEDGFVRAFETLFGVKL